MSSALTRLRKGGAKADTASTALVASGGSGGAAAGGAPTASRQLIVDETVINVVHKGKKLLGTVLQMGLRSAALASMAGEVAAHLPQKNQWKRLGPKAGVEPPTEEQLDDPGLDDAEFFEVEPNPSFDRAAYVAWCTDVTQRLLAALGPLLAPLCAQDAAVLDADLPLLTELRARAVFDGLDAGSQAMLLECAAALANDLSMYTMFTSRCKALVEMQELAASALDKVNSGGASTLGAMMEAFATMQERMSNLGEEEAAEMAQFLSRDGQGFMMMAEQMKPQLQEMLAAKGGGGGPMAALAAVLGGGEGEGGGDAMGMLASMMGSLGQG
jgi:hypothetical protein